MKTLCLIGGLSWHSTIDYNRVINQLVNDRPGGVYSASLYLYSVDVDPVKNWTLADDWASLATLMGGSAINLDHADAQVLVICANSMHHIADEIQVSIGIPVIHIAGASTRSIRLQD